MDDLFNVFPFNNSITTIYLSGNDIQTCWTTRPVEARDGVCHPGTALGRRVHDELQLPR